MDFLFFFMEIFSVIWYLECIRYKCVKMDYTKNSKRLIYDYKCILRCVPGTQLMITSAKNINNTQLLKTVATLETNFRERKPKLWPKLRASIRQYLLQQRHIAISGYIYPELLGYCITDAELFSLRSRDDIFSPNQSFQLS